MRYSHVALLLLCVLCACREERGVSWGDVRCVEGVENGLVKFTFLGLSHSRHPCGVNTGASIYSRYSLNVLSKEYLFFSSSDIGDLMFFKSLTGNLYMAPARCCDHDKGVYCILEDRMVDCSNCCKSAMECALGKQELGRSENEQAVVLVFKESNWIRRFVVSGEFRLHECNFGIDSNGCLLWNSRIVDANTAIKVLKIEENTLLIPGKAGPYSKMARGEGDKRKSK